MIDTRKTSLTLTESESALWDRPDVAGNDFRLGVRAELQARAEAIRVETLRGSHLEIYSHDGITLDAWDVDANPRYRHSYETGATYGRDRYGRSE